MLTMTIHIVKYCLRSSLRPVFKNDEILIDNVLNTYIFNPINRESFKYLNDEEYSKVYKVLNSDNVFDLFINKYDELGIKDNINKYISRLYEIISNDIYNHNPEKIVDNVFKYGKLEVNNILKRFKYRKVSTCDLPASSILNYKDMSTKTLDEIIECGSLLKIKYKNFEICLIGSGKFGYVYKITCGKYRFVMKMTILKNYKRHNIKSILNREFMIYINILKNKHLSIYAPKFISYHKTFSNIDDGEFKKYRNIMFYELYECDLKSFFNMNMFNISLLNKIFVYIIYMLLEFNKYSTFRHGDIKLSNMLIKKCVNKRNIKFKYEDIEFVIKDFEYDIVLWDFSHSYFETIESDHECGFYIDVAKLLYNINNTIITYSQKDIKCFEEIYLEDVKNIFSYKINNDFKHFEYVHEILTKTLKSSIRTIEYYTRQQSVKLQCEDF